MRVKSNRDLAAERMSPETVLDALARRHQIERAPAAKEQAAPTPPAQGPIVPTGASQGSMTAPDKTRLDGFAMVPAASGVPSLDAIRQELTGCDKVVLDTLATWLCFAEIGVHSNRAVAESSAVLRRLGTQPGCSVAPELRERIAAVMGWTEPAFPDWAKVNVWCRRWTIRGSISRILWFEGTVAVLDFGQRIPAGELRFAWEPVTDAPGA